VVGDARQVADALVARCAGAIDRISVDLPGATQEDIEVVVARLKQG